MTEELRAGESGESVPVEIPRTETGQFVKGHSGNPGGRRKSDIKHLQRDLEHAFRMHLTPEKVKRVIDKLFNMAVDGNVKAAKLILDKLVPNATDSDEQADNGRTVVFRIENATFAAQQQQAQLPAPSDQSAIIDVTPIEVKSE